MASKISLNFGIVHTLNQNKAMNEEDLTIEIRVLRHFQPAREAELAWAGFEPT